MLQTRTIRPQYHNRGLQKPQYTKISDGLGQRSLRSIHYIFFNLHLYSQQVHAFDIYYIYRGLLKITRFQNIISAKSVKDIFFKIKLQDSIQTYINFKLNKSLL